MTYHRPRTYPTVTAQRKRLEWMLKLCDRYGWLHLAQMIEKQLEALSNG